MVLDISCESEYSKEEKVLIETISPHWIKVIQSTHISPIKLYEILCVEAFVENKNGPEIEALRLVIKAIQDGKIYRMTPEFNKLCEF